MLTRIQMLIWWTTNTMFFYITIPCTRKYTNDRNEHLLCRVSQEALTLMALDMSLLCLCIFVFLYHNTMHQEDRNEHLLCRVSQEALTHPPFLGHPGPCVYPAHPLQCIALPGWIDFCIQFVMRAFLRNSWWINTDENLTKSGCHWYLDTIPELVTLGFWRHCLETPIHVGLGW